MGADARDQRELDRVYAALAGLEHVPTNDLSIGYVREKLAYADLHGAAANLLRIAAGVERDTRVSVRDRRRLAALALRLGLLAESRDRRDAVRLFPTEGIGSVVRPLEWRGILLYLVLSCAVTAVMVAVLLWWDNDVVNRSVAEAVIAGPMAVVMTVVGVATHVRSRARWRRLVASTIASDARLVAAGEPAPRDGVRWDFTKVRREPTWPYVMSMAMGVLLPFLPVLGGEHSLGAAALVWVPTATATYATVLAPERFRPVVVVGGGVALAALVVGILATAPGALVLSVLFGLLTGWGAASWQRARARRGVLRAALPRATR